MGWNVTPNIEIVLQAARLIENECRNLGIPCHFHLERLAVACWEIEPILFGMQFYPHPDVNRLKSVICGKRGMVARGWLEKVRPNIYRLGRLAKEDLD